MEKSLKMKMWTNETCLNCPNLMKNEWYAFADDDIQLCHACYNNENLRKHSYAKI